MRRRRRRRACATELPWPFRYCSCCSSWQAQPAVGLGRQASPRLLWTPGRRGAGSTAARQELAATHSVRDELRPQQTRRSGEGHRLDL
jgi:hypothetical protein